MNVKKQNTKLISSYEPKHLHHSLRVESVSIHKKAKKWRLRKIFHVQDIEDYHDKEQLNKFKLIVDDIEKAKKECNISSYDLAYSNYTFDLWMILHKYDLKHQ